VSNIGETNKLIGGLDLYRRSVSVTPGKLAGFRHQRDCYCFLDCGIVVLEKEIGMTGMTGMTC
jgi:hypothetical protein